MVSSPPTRSKACSWRARRSLTWRLAETSPNLVEEERAPVGELEAAEALLHRPGERPPLVAEELGLEEGVGERPAVDLHEGALRARREAVDGPGDQLLAGARFPVDVDGGVGLGHLLHRGEHLPHHLALADHLPEPRGAGDVGAQRGVLRLQPAHPLLEARELQGLFDLGPEHLAGERLGEEVVGPEPHRLDGDLDGAKGGDQEHRGVGVVGADGLEDLEAVDRLHLEVGDHHGEAVLAEGGDARLAARGGGHLVARLLEGDGHALPEGLVVVDDEDVGHGCG